MHWRQWRRHGVQHEFPMVFKRDRFDDGGQRRIARLRHQSLRGVHGRGQVRRFHQEELTINIDLSDINVFFFLTSNLHYNVIIIYYK